MLKWIKPVAFLAFGFFFLVVASTLKKVGVPEWLSMLFLLALFCFVFSIKMGLLKRFKSVLALSKIHYLFYGTVIGFGLLGLSYLFSGSEVQLNGLEKVSLQSILITLTIVSWEELWFRGPALDYAGKVYSKVGASVVFSVCFVLLHALNPNMSLIKAAPDLFLGSMLLSLAYFLSNSLWMPIGIHFGNNFFGSIWRTSDENSLLALIEWARQDDNTVEKIELKVAEKNIPALNLYRKMGFKEEGKVLGELKISGNEYLDTPL